MIDATGHSPDKPGRRRTALKNMASLSVGAWLAPLLVAGATDTPPGSPFRLKRWFTGTDGLTHLEEMKPSEANRGELFARPAVSVALRTFPAGKVWDWHNSGVSRLIIVVQGQAETELSDGTIMTSGPGSIVLAEDSTGKGHRGRVIGNVPTVNIDLLLAP